MPNRKEQMTYTNNYTKSYRLLDMNDRFIRGEQLSKRQLAELYQVDNRTVQRDIADLNDYFLMKGGDQRVDYVQSLKAYKLHRTGEGAFTDYDIYAISKVLLESRAFSKDEMDRLLNTLLDGAQDRARIDSLILNEQFHYVEPRHGKQIIDFIWKVAKSIQEHQTVSIDYVRQDGRKRSYIIEPLGLIFSEYYFYLIAYRAEDQEHQTLVYRIDRFEDYQPTGETFHIEYKDRFQEGEFRKRIQFMYTGPLTTITFEFSGDSLEAVLDRLPTAVVTGSRNGKTIVKAEVFGEGVRRWLLSQKEFLTVLSPQSYRKEIAETIRRMAANYD